MKTNKVQCLYFRRIFVWNRPKLSRQDYIRKIFVLNKPKQSRQDYIRKIFVLNRPQQSQQDYIKIFVLNRPQQDHFFHISISSETIRPNWKVQFKWFFFFWFGIGRLVAGSWFSLVLWFPPPTNWLPQYNWNIVKRGIKHHHDHDPHSNWCRWNSLFCSLPIGWTVQALEIPWLKLCFLDHAWAYNIK